MSCFEAVGPGLRFMCVLLAAALASLASIDTPEGKIEGKREREREREKERERGKRERKRERETETEERERKRERERGIERGK